MDEFLRLSIRNAVRNDDYKRDEIISSFNPVKERLEKILCKEVVEELEDEFLDIACDAFEESALYGMKLAIGVLNGTIKQVIEA